MLRISSPDGGNSAEIPNHFLLGERKERNAVDQTHIAKNRVNTASHIAPGCEHRLDQNDGVGP